MNNQNTSNAPKLVNLESSKTQWTDEAQAGELAFHVKPGWRSDDQVFKDRNSSLLKRLGFTKDQFAGKRVIDLGAGSKLRSTFFENAEIIAIEPLAEEFIEKIPWCDLKDAAQVYSTPAETMIVELENSADLLLSINVLDHCYNFTDVNLNIFRYLKPGGLACLSFDCHSKIDKLHPLILNESIATTIFFDMGFIINKFVRTTSYHKKIAEYSTTYYLTK